MKKITAILVLLLMVISTLPIESAQACFVQVGQVCTPIYSYIPPCPPPVVVCPPIAPPPVICPPDPCPPKKVKPKCPTKELSPRTLANIKNIRAEAKYQLNELRAYFPHEGWRLGKAEMARDMSARYAYRLPLINERGSRKFIYQVTLLLGDGSFETFYSWNLPLCEPYDYNKVGIDGSIYDLLEWLETN